MVALNLLTATQINTATLPSLLTPVAEMRKAQPLAESEDHNVDFLVVPLSRVQLATLRTQMLTRIILVDAGKSVFPLSEEERSAILITAQVIEDMLDGMPDPINTDWDARIAAVQMSTTFKEVMNNETMA